MKLNFLRSLVSSVAEHWSRKPGVEGSTPSRGYSNALCLRVSSLLWDTYPPFTCCGSSSIFQNIPLSCCQEACKKKLSCPLSLFPCSRSLFRRTEFFAETLPTGATRGPFLIAFNVIASLAQWQSTGLVNQGSRVQIPHEASLLGLHVWLAK